MLLHVTDSSEGHNLLPGRTCSTGDSPGVEADKGPVTSEALTSSEGGALKFTILMQVPKIGQSNLTHPLLAVLHRLYREHGVTLSAPGLNA